VVREPDPPAVLERFHGTLDLVESLTRQVYRAIGRTVEMEELRSFGSEGLLEAARRFDEERGVPFRAYATFRIRGAIIDGVRKNCRMPRRAAQRLRGLEAADRVSEGALQDVSAPPAPGATRADAERALNEHLAAIATAMATGMIREAARDEDGELVPVDEATDPETVAMRAELVGAVERALGDLPDQQQTLVRRHYLGGEHFDRVAAELGLSKSWASRLHTRAIAHLSRRLREAIA
jgi:RNA polymerase sigma factor for flagellar operon FliA